MVSVRVLVALNIDDAFIFQSERRSPDLEIEVSDYVVHSFAKLCSEQMVGRRPPPLPRYVIAARIDFVPERYVSIDEDLKRLGWIRASIDAAFDCDGKEHLIKGALKLVALNLVLNAS